MLSRIIYGSRVSLAIGFSSVLLAIFIGVLLETVAGFYGGATDTVVMWTMDLILSFPVLLLAIIMVMFTPTACLVSRTPDAVQSSPGVERPWCGPVTR